MVHTALAPYSTGLWQLSVPLPAPTEASLGLDLTRTDLAHCLDQLPATQRLAILLAYYRGMTHQELAQALGAPLGTVKSWVRRGLSNLKDCLG